MRVLVIGSGGREHALVWAFSRSGHNVYCAPGNAGISRLAECADIDPLNINSLAQFARKQKIDLTVVGPEAPLVAGLADEFEKKGLKVFGPNKTAAQLEGDKAFTKNLLAKYNIPTARFAVFEDYNQAAKFISSQRFPIVVKATGLAAGKGVVVANSVEQALTTLNSFMKEGKLGEAGKQVVIEEFLEGEEASIIALCDGAHLHFFVPSQDHKRLLDGDAGPNTGGMGAYAPVPVVTREIFNRVVNEIFNPLLLALKKEGIDYRGAIYAGLMLTPEGPKVLEFNCRFGDPETQVIVPLFEGDLAELCLECALGNLKEQASPEWGKRWALCVVAASQGYPGNYEKGLPISGKLEEGEQTIVFHAGTKMVDDRIVTNGGRVLAVTGLGSTLSEARDRAYYGLGLIHFSGMHYRRDIGEKGLRHLARTVISP
ncbi:MAG: phosphoribosylamine--glycine ligase [candidate division WOR-3 bacterium]|jgi:phosphoribosylamine--glycine ligase|nr:phosphoribosylamine--glycine ligase [candidate division WOR-3 bacterium]MDH7519242.1 phosphoribosylamine--glycine ligase [bacterium]